MYWRLQNVPALVVVKMEYNLNSNLDRMIVEERATFERCEGETGVRRARLKWLGKKLDSKRTSTE